MNQEDLINLISKNLEAFRRVNRNLYNFRCPICGDSQKSRIKTRGYIFRAKRGDFAFKCQNCSSNMSLPNFAKQIDPATFREYLLAKMRNPTANTNQYEIKKTLRKVDSVHLNKLTPIRELPKDHPALKYVQGRKIPFRSYDALYYSEQFITWLSSFYHKDISKKGEDEARLVLPFVNKNGIFYGLQGRSLDPNSKLRYITAMLDNTDDDKVFGLDKVNLNKDFFITEGPIDSLFLQNSIAMAGSSIPAKYLTNDNSIIVYDNEPRNKQICANIRKAINAGSRIVIWPEGLNEKDLNDMVLAGMTPEALEALILENTFKGPKAILEFNRWKRI